MSSEGSFYSQSLGKYWQLNQSNQHTSTYSRIQQQTKNLYYATIHNEYTQENQQDRQKITFHGSANPKAISQQYTPATHRSSAVPGGPLGVFHPCLWPLKASWIHLEGVFPMKCGQWYQCFTARQYVWQPLLTINIFSVTSSILTATFNTVMTWMQHYSTKMQKLPWCVFKLAWLFTEPVKNCRQLQIITHNLTLTRIFCGKWLWKGELDLTFHLVLCH